LLPGVFAFVWVFESADLFNSSIPTAIKAHLRISFNQPFLSFVRKRRLAICGYGAARSWVRDEGIGVPRAAHQKIFGIFERGVESELGKGSRFRIELQQAEEGRPLP
jgi:hypothetical protein